MSTPTPQPTLTQAPTTGFDTFQSSSGTASGTATQGFPQQYAQAPYPGLSSKELTLVVPGSGTPGVTAFPFAPGEQQRMEPQEGGTGEQSIQALMDNLIKWSQSDPEAIASKQDQLILAGYLDPRSKTYTPGGFVQPGDATWTAYRNLLLDAVRQKTSYIDLLDQKAQAGIGDRKFNLSQSYQSVSVTDPQTASMKIASVMEGELGRRPTNAEISDYVSRLSGTERAYPTTTTQHTDINAYLNDTSQGGGGTPTQTSTVTGGSDPTAVAEQQIYDNNGTELAQTRATELYQLFLRMLSGEGSLA